MYQVRFSQNPWAHKQREYTVDSPVQSPELNRLSHTQGQDTAYYDNNIYIFITLSSTQSKASKQINISDPCAIESAGISPVSTVILMIPHMTVFHCSQKPIKLL